MVEEIPGILSQGREKAQVRRDSTFLRWLAFANIPQPFSGGWGGRSPFVCELIRPALGLGAEELRVVVLKRGESSMKMVFSTRLRVAVLTASVFLLPLQQLLAANPQVLTAQAPVIRDIALQAGGVMHGQVLDAQGAPCSQVEVRVGKNSDPAPLAAVQTDSQGRFAVSGLSGGLYRVETPAGAALYRMWAPNTAPPSATASALVVQGDPAMRGNLGGLGWFGWTLIGLGVAAAIAIPLALDDDDDAS